MHTKEPLLNERQRIFKDILIGTLIYSVVLGFFNDYTNIVFAKSFSTIIMASIVLEIMTFLVKMFKKNIVAWLKGKPGLAYRILMFLSVWLVLFISKFVFIAVLDLLFKDYIYVHGFFGILIVVASVTLLAKLTDFIFMQLGTSSQSLVEK